MKNNMIISFIYVCFDSNYQHYVSLEQLVTLHTYKIITVIMHLFIVTMSKSCRIKWKKLNELTSVLKKIQFWNSYLGDANQVVVTTGTWGFGI